MNMISSEMEKDIFDCLKSQGCCIRCCLRFIGWRTLKCYEQPFEFARQIGYIQTNEDFSGEIACIGCLGILQDKVQESVIERIKHKIENENYDCQTFNCALTIPISIRLREKSLHIYVTEELELSKDISQTLELKVQSVKDVWKLIVIPKLEQILHKAGEPTSPFLIEIFLTYPHEQNDCNLLLKYNTKEVNLRKRKFNKFSRKNIETLLSDITKTNFLELFSVPPIKPDTLVATDNVMCSHNSIFIGGRYNKFSRELSQTPWFINGEKKMDTSVQDILGNPIAEIVKADSIKFLSSGREDVDVRNIYSGRPFAIELMNPRMTNITEKLLSNLVDEINASTDKVKITSNLKVLSRSDLVRLKEGENIKTKFYRALCICHTVPEELKEFNILNEMKNLKIVQKTPIRVLHRRPLSSRIRCIYEMRARWLKDHELNHIANSISENCAYFVLDVKTQAGTYVKEFVHGDFGRTKPNLCSLLNADIDIVALDVTGINLTWP